MTEGSCWCVNERATTEVCTLSLHDAVPSWKGGEGQGEREGAVERVLKKEGEGVREGGGEVRSCVTELHYRDGGGDMTYFDVKPLPLLSYSIHTHTHTHTAGSGATFKR